MPRFFVSEEQILDGIVRISEEDAHHIARSLRMAVGEEVIVCDGNSTEYRCVLRRITDGEVLAEILASAPSDAEPPYRAYLFQALPKGDKLDSIIQKAVECGVFRIIPFESERCVARVKPEQETKKTERRQKIAEAAAKQSGRGIIPVVSETLSYSEMLRKAAECDVRLFCYEGEGTIPLAAALKHGSLRRKPGADVPPPTVAVVIGSEGGFSREEAEEAKQAGFLLSGLGKRILRTETASTFVLSALVYALELCEE